MKNDFQPPLFHKQILGRVIFARKRRFPRFDPPPQPDISRYVPGINSSYISNPMQIHLFNQNLINGRRTFLRFLWLQFREVILF